MNRIKSVGEMLKEAGYITDEQLQEAIAKQKELKVKKLESMLIQLGYVTEKQVIDTFASNLNYHIIDLKTYNINPNAVAKIPKAIAVKYNVLGVNIRNNRLTIITNEPLNFFMLEDIRQITSMPIDILLCDSENIKKAIDTHYENIEAQLAAKEANAAVSNVEAEADTDLDLSDEDAPAVKLLASLLVRGQNANASDIHIEPFEDKTNVRLRIDGVLIDYLTLSPGLPQSLIARLKILSNLDIAERRIPQDGHFKTKIENLDINIRVSILPTVFGEKAVLRYLSTNSKIDRMGKFGMSDENYQKFAPMLKSPHGIIYITGPTGSGKTTTLYMVLEHMAEKEINVSTVEDPVERNLYRVNQVQVNNVAGMTFGAALRSLLRQDPDVIMVGETRDAETAQISVRAAITGHLVFSTLHTNDAISSIVRLNDMGVPEYLVANSLVGIIAQRLVRKICPECKKAHPITETERAILGCGDEIQEVYKGEGCPVCGNSGYKGRISVHEILTIDKQVRKLITTKAPTEEIERYAHDVQGMLSLRESTLELVKQGITTVDEFLKITYYSD